MPGERSGTDEEAERDAALLAEMDGALARAVEAAGGRLDHHRGCPACCIGPFPITVLDARRLRRGLRALAARDPDGAAAVRRRAREVVARVAASFPGDPATGRLADDDAAEERFAEAWADLPCPALDPTTGSCDLYSHRPLSCRSYGPPVRVGSQNLPPCQRCFVGSAEEAETCRALLDPEGGRAAPRPGRPGARGRDHRGLRPGHRGLTRGTPNAPKMSDGCQREDAQGLRGRPPVRCSSHP